MEPVLLLIVNIILYIFLLFINFRFKISNEKKIESYRNENRETLELFRDELFRKNRRFELRYDIYKGFASELPRIHWVITQFDLTKLAAAFERIWFNRVLVENFYGKKVKKILEDFNIITSEIGKKRDKINAEISKIMWERAEIEQQKKYFQIISSSPPQSMDEIYKRMELETTIKIKDKENFKRQTKIISDLISEIKDALNRVYPYCEKVLKEMSNELKEEYKL